MRTAPRVGIAITHHVNRDDVFSVSLVRCSWSVAYCLLAAGHLARQDTRDRARSEVALVVNIMSLLKMMKCQRPVPALNMYAPSAQVLTAGPKPRYVIGCLRALETWTRLRTCLRTLCHETPEAEEGATLTLAIAPPLYYYYYVLLLPLSLFSQRWHQANSILGVRHLHNHGALRLASASLQGPTTMQAWTDCNLSEDPPLEYN